MEEYVVVIDRGMNTIVFAYRVLSKFLNNQTVILLSLVCSVFSA